MKNKKIKEEFSNYIKQGFKNYEIRKDGDLEGEVELIVFNENFLNCNPGKVVIGKPIKDILKVRLKKTDMTAFSIGWKFERLYWEYKFENEEKRKMIAEVLFFIEKWFKQGDKLYWYDITHIYLDDKWVEYKEIEVK